MNEHFLEGPAWDALCQRYALSDSAKKKILKYAVLLVEENKQYNLTALTDADDIIHYHIDDALRLTTFLDFSLYLSIADIGSGCGVPGIILAMYYPSTHFYLVEVLQKRRIFLEKVCSMLGVENCTIVSLDFKSLVRKGPYPLDLFIARASLPLTDLLYIYSGASRYQQSGLVYWATAHQRIEEMLMHDATSMQDKVVYSLFPYKVGTRDRTYVYAKPSTS